MFSISTPIISSMGITRIIIVNIIIYWRLILVFCLLFAEYKESHFILATFTDHDGHNGHYSAGELGPILGVSTFNGQLFLV